MGHAPARLEYALLLHPVVDDDGGNTGCDLGHHVGDGVVRGDAPVEQRSRRDRGVEVTAADAADQERQDRQSRTDRPRVARGDDDGDKNEGADKLHEDRQRIHDRGFLLVEGDFCRGLA